LVACGGAAEQEDAVNAYEQRLVAIGLLCNLLTLLVLAPGWLPAAPVAAAAERRPAARAAATVYGADPSRTQAAVRASGWPQTGHNWCGVATVAAIARYRGDSVSQAGVATWMNSGAAISAWGTPSWNGAGPGFKANIARDSGTDPRALAAALDAQAQGGYRQLVDDAGRRDATAHLVADLVRTQEPISVFVLRGLHSVLVSGVLATADPVRHPESILGLQVWDPGVSSAYGQIQPTQETDVPLSQWLGLWVYWADPYNPNYTGGLPADPDPAVGPYTYDPARGLTQHLWIGHYVYLQPGVTPGLNVDWAYDQNGNLIPGTQGETPTATAQPTAAASGLRVGLDAEVVNSPILHLRTGPGLANDIITTMPLGSIVSIISGPTPADGYQWWQVRFQDTVGFAAGDWLAPVGQNGLAAGDVAQVVNSPYLHLRSGPGLGNEIIATMLEGAQVEVVTGPTSADGYQWWQVRYQGVVGFAAGDWLVPTGATVT
jgi:hypothetical protein